MFYTGVIGSGGLAPIAYGAIADHSSQMIGILASAGTALVIVPLVLSLSTVFTTSEGGWISPLPIRDRFMGSYERHILREVGHCVPAEGSWDVVAAVERLLRG